MTPGDRVRDLTDGSECRLLEWVPANQWSFGKPNPAGYWLVQARWRDRPREYSRGRRYPRSLEVLK